MGCRDFGYYRTDCPSGIACCLYLFRRFDRSRWIQADPDLAIVDELANIGIIFLLFLLGMDLYPQKLIKIFQSVTVVTAATSVIFFGLGFAVAFLFGFTIVEAVVTGVATGLSSTIIGIKLLPTTVLHHRHIGELMIGVLLLQDLLAIMALIAIEELGQHAEFGLTVLRPLITLPFYIWLAFLLERLSFEFCFKNLIKSMSISF